MIQTAIPQTMLTTRRDFLKVSLAAGLGATFGTRTILAAVPALADAHTHKTGYQVKQFAFRPIDKGLPVGVIPGLEQGHRGFIRRDFRSEGCSLHVLA